MTLKCPICGKEYFYESKICSDCETHSVRSLLISKHKILGENWNCGIFLERSNVTFGRRKLDEYGWSNPIENFEFNMKERKIYTWNCMSVKDPFKIELCKTIDIEKTTNMEILNDKRKQISLIYE